jgi:HSP20 family protein
MLPILRDGSLTPTVDAPVNRLSNFLDRFFDDDFFAPLPAATRIAAVPLSMWEDDEHLYVEMDAPGIAEKDIDVSVHNGELVVRGERRCERRANGYDTRTYGRFEQRISLPAWVRADQVDAKLANGVLSVTFSKGEEAKPRKIALRSE